MRGDLNDINSIQQVVDGAEAVYLVTSVVGNTPDVETEQGKRAVDVLAKSPTLKHFIFSSLPSVSKLSGGKYNNVAHFESKARIAEYIKTTYPELWAKTTELWIAGYFQIWVQFPYIFSPQKDENGTWVLRQPVDKDDYFPQVDVRDVGKVVRAILAKGTSKLGGKTVKFQNKKLRTQSEILNSWGAILGRNVEFRKISEKEFGERVVNMGLPEAMAIPIVEVVRFTAEFGATALQDDGVIQSKDVRIFATLPV